LRGLICQAAQLATGDAPTREKAIEEAVKVLDGEFSYEQMSIVVATKIHEVIREITRNPDPYRAVKKKEMAIARELCSELSLQAEAASRRHGRRRSNLSKDDFQGCLRLAAAANTIDFFREPDSIRAEVSKPIDFVVDDSQQFELRLREAGKILYLADNAGEIYFDLPLVRYMRRFADVVYMVKPSPVQDDATLEDVREAGLETEFGAIMTTGVASPGVIFALASGEFKLEFESADLIFAKGMGHYEALSELPRQGKFFYCLKAKCRPVAESLGVPLNSYVAMLQ
jgi:hypothetical protein